MNSNQLSKGFTIVELLIVVVVIAILAAITIVSYNGISTRAKTSAAKSNASSVLVKIEAYNAEKSSYPVKMSDLTDASSNGTTYQIKGINFVTSMPASAPSDQSTILITKCDNGTGSTGGTGNQIVYWDYGSNNIAALTTGSFVNCTVAS